MEDERGNLLRKHLQQITNARYSVNWEIPETFGKMQDMKLNNPLKLVAFTASRACEKQKLRSTVGMSPYSRYISAPSSSSLNSLTSNRV
jgi:hypothetical protein